MCGRYYLDNEIDDNELSEILEEIQRKIDSLDDTTGIRLSGEIFPTNTVPIITNNKALAPKPFLMKWGIIPPWNEKQLLINARSETAATKNIFKNGMKERRCLIPATNYFEWQKTDSGKVKHSIKPTGSKAFYMAGIYRLHDNNPEFTILTRDPAPEIEFIHNRMPVILPAKAKKDWLNIKYDAEEVIKSAMLDMEFEAV